MTDKPMLLYTATYDSVSAAMTDLAAIEQLSSWTSPRSLADYHPGCRARTADTGG